jgi:hypothetical protein
VGLRPLTYWDRGFESHRGHACLSLVSVVCCQVEVSATSWSLVQGSPTECGVSQLCVIMKPRRNEEAQAHIRLSNHKKKANESKYSRMLINQLQPSALNCPTHGYSTAVCSSASTNPSHGICGGGGGYEVTGITTIIIL